MEGVVIAVIVIINGKIIEGMHFEIINFSMLQGDLEIAIFSAYAIAAAVAVAGCI